MKTFHLKIGLVIIFAAAAVHLTYSQPKSEKEVEAMLDNYSISLTFDANTSYHFYQARCEQGSVFKMEGDDGNYAFTLYDEVAKKVYSLNSRTKTGKVMPLDPRMSYQGFSPMLASHLFLHTNYLDDKNFKKTDRHETVAGRKATVYTMTFGDGKGTFWIDDQYGFTLKYTQEGSNDMHTEVTEFKTGGVTMADMVNLNEYKIEAVGENK